MSESNSTFEKCMNIRQFIMNRAAEVIVYGGKGSWSPEFCFEQMTAFVEKQKKNSPDYYQIQPSELTSEQMDTLRFGRWSEDDPMRLIPLWLFPFLADDVRVRCIDGSETLKKADMDDDHRFGQLAYGVLPADHEISGCKDCCCR